MGAAEEVVVVLGVVAHVRCWVFVEAATRISLTRFWSVLPFALLASAYAASQIMSPPKRGWQKYALTKGVISVVGSR